jgi:hypothetical protein
MSYLRMMISKKGKPIEWQEQKINIKSRTTLSQVKAKRKVKLNKEKLLFAKPMMKYKPT